MLPNDFDENFDELRRLVTSLRYCWQDGITTSGVEAATTDLSHIRRIKFQKRGPVLLEKGYEYDSGKFPPITQKTFEPPEHELNRKTGPTNLAEALLWKKGDWGKYVDFIDDFKNAKSEPEARNSGPVFFAFAEYLNDRRSRPIFDQHSVRALWVLSDEQWELDSEPYRRYLLQGRDGKETWRNGQAKDYVANPVISDFWACITSACSANNVDQSKLDNLIMPLGQALKHYAKWRNGTSHYAGLIELAGREASSRPRKPKSS